jgi:HEAT repeat protein
VLLALVAPAMSGCAQFWDDVMYRPFSFKRVFLPDPDPMVVLHESNNPNDRARALQRLKEPKQHGGSDDDQKLVLDILSTAATADVHAYSRVCAIGALSHFKDPRAVQILQASYFAAGKLALESGPLVDKDRRDQQIHDIECAALKALGDTKSTDAISVLVLALQQPPTDSKNQLVVLRSRQLRLTAARALGNFDDKRATAPLLDVLHEEKDVAMLDGARDALCQSTGKSYPADYRVWDDYLNQHGTPPEQGFDIKVIHWLGLGK